MPRPIAILAVPTRKVNFDVIYYVGILWLLDQVTVLYSVLSTEVTVNNVLLTYVQIYVIGHTLFC